MATGSLLPGLLPTSMPPLPVIEPLLHSPLHARSSPLPTSSTSSLPAAATPTASRALKLPPSVPSSVLLQPSPGLVSPLGALLQAEATPIEDGQWKSGWSERGRCDGGGTPDGAEADGVGDSFGLEDAALLRDLASLLCDEPSVERT